MADLEEEADPYKDVDIDALWSKVQRRPLTISRKKSVFLAPDFIQRLKGEQTVNEGNDLTLFFKVNGVPRPTLRWFKDDEEVTDHPRLSVEEQEEGSFRLVLHQVNKGDEAAYRCRAENAEGTSSCCFFLTVKGKPKSPKKGHKRTVSFPTMFSTIVEKVEEEEKAGKEASGADASPLSHYYDSLTLKGRATWHSFLGDWAFVNGSHKARGGSTGSYTSTGSESDAGQSPSGDGPLGDSADSEGGEPDDVFPDAPEATRPASDVTAAPGVVFFLQAPEHRAERVGALPPDADRPPPAVASRGEAGSLPLTSRRGGGQTDSGGVSSARGEGERVTSQRVDTEGEVCSPGEEKEEEKKAVTETRERAPFAEEGAGAGTAKEDKPEQAASPSAAAGDGASSPSSGPPASSSSLTSSSPASQLSTKAQVTSPSAAKQNSFHEASSLSPSSPSPSPSPSPEPQHAGSVAEPKVEPTKRAPKVPYSSENSRVSLRGGGEGRPVVRGPLGALISSGGDAASKTTPTPRISPAGKKSVGSTTRSPDVTVTSPTKLPSPGKAGSSSPDVILTSPANLPAVGATGASGFPRSRASNAAASAKSPAVTVTSPTDLPSPGREGSLGPAVTVTSPEDLPVPSEATGTQGPPALQEVEGGKMCDCCSTDQHYCSNRSSTYHHDFLGDYRSRARSESTTASVSGTITPSRLSISSAATTTPPSSECSLSPSHSPSSHPASPSTSENCGLRAPEFSREEREPTPIPPDRLIVTHLPTGSSFLVQSYGGNLRPPVSRPPRSSGAGSGSGSGSGSGARNRPFILSDPSSCMNGKLHNAATPERREPEPERREPERRERPESVPDPPEPVPESPEPVPEHPNPHPKPEPYDPSTEERMLDREVTAYTSPEDQPEPYDPSTEERMLDREVTAYTSPEDKLEPSPPPEEPAMVWETLPPIETEGRLEPKETDTDPPMIVETSYSAHIQVKVGHKPQQQEPRPESAQPEPAPKPVSPQPEPESNRPEPDPEADRWFYKQPGETLFTRASPAPDEGGIQEEPQSSSSFSSHARKEGTASRSDVPQPPASCTAMEAIYFDPVHQELVHYKRIKDAPSPLAPAQRAMSAQETGHGRPSARKGPGQRGGRRGSDHRPKSDCGIYSSISRDPERDLVWQYFRELAFVICLLTFLGLVLDVRPHIFVGVVLVVHLALFLSRKCIFVRK
ncbi:uncharacterized protein LOC143277028 [Babylonia areolata]|uniref:uncharacterized protein LOC143277028 n=1 Tax=Babylonia areolata TaxID=304850 RepID=UPI003FD45ED9